MVRYPITTAELKRRIQNEQGTETWLEKAKVRTERFRAAKKYDESQSIWSDVKGVYMQLQHNKCAYCERQLEDQMYGKIEHDLEHYRPKNSVKSWVSGNPNSTIDYPTGDAWAEGYYLLAYHIENYATACKTCNTPLKSNYFPIAGPRGPQGDNPRTLRTEKPLLIYPIGQIDTDPQELITFDGILPKPTSQRTTSYKYRRAEVTIDFFALDRRAILRQQRARSIVALGMALSLLDEDSNNEDGKTAVAIFTSPKSPHCNCAQAFLALYQDDTHKAQQILELALAYLLQSRGVDL